MTNGESQEFTPSKHTITLKIRALKDQTYPVDLEGLEREDYSGELANNYLA